MFQSLGFPSTSITQRQTVKRSYPIMPNGGPQLPPEPHEDKPGNDVCLNKRHCCRNLADVQRSIPSPDFIPAVRITTLCFPLASTPSPCCERLQLTTPSLHSAPIQRFPRLTIPCAARETPMATSEQKAQRKPHEYAGQGEPGWSKESCSRRYRWQSRRITEHQNPNMGHFFRSKMSDFRRPPGVAFPKNVHCTHAASQRTTNPCRAMFRARGSAISVTER